MTATMPRVLWCGAGGDRIECAVLTALAREGLIVGGIAESGSAAADCFDDLGLPWTPHRFSGRIDRTGIRRIRDRLEADRPTHLHALTNRALANGLLAARGNRALRIIAYRGTCGHLSRLDPASWMSYLSPRIDRVVCVSHAVRRYLRSMGLPDHRLEVIYKGHDPAWYADTTPVSRRDLGLPDEAVVAGFVGNMRPVKGVRYLIEAMEHIPPDHPLRLLLIGEVREASLLKLAARPAVRGRIHLLGFRKDAAALYPAMDLSVMPSVEREGLPRAMLESMAQGVPCIGTQVGGIPELVEDGVSGLLVPPRDPAALAEALRRLADTPAPRARMAAAARARVEGPFHLHHTIDQTRNLYHRLLASR